MRKRWACPDLGLVRGNGLLVIRGSDEEFPDCPAYYLRASGNAAHLIDGAIHPAELASLRSMEIKNGAAKADDMTPKGLEAAMLWAREDADHTRWDQEQRKASRGA